MDKVHIADMSWQEFEKTMVSNDLIIVPVGSTEAHGPHNPLGTDTFIASHAAEEVGKKVNAPVAPAMPLGNARALTGFPGTAHIDPSILRETMFQVCESLVQHGARRFLFINGHGGNADTLQLVAADLYREYGVVATNTEWWTTLPHISDMQTKEHGGRYETSLAMVATDGLVDSSRIEDEPQRNSLMGEVGIGEFEGAPVRLPLAMDRLFPAGYFGEDVSESSRELGEKSFATYIEFCADLAEELRKIVL